MKSVTIVVTMCVVIGGGILLNSADAQEPKKMAEKEFILKPIGSVHKENGCTILLLNKDVEPALLGLDGFSHVWVHHQSLGQLYIDQLEQSQEWKQKGRLKNK